MILPIESSALGGGPGRKRATDMRITKAMPLRASSCRVPELDIAWISFPTGVAPTGAGRLPLTTIRSYCRQDCRMVAEG